MDWDSEIDIQRRTFTMWREIAMRMDDQEKQAVRAEPYGTEAAIGAHVAMECKGTVGDLHVA